MTDSSTSTAAGNAVSGKQHGIRAAQAWPNIGQRAELSARDRVSCLELGRAQARLARHLDALRSLELDGKAGARRQCRVVATPTGAGSSCGIPAHANPSLVAVESAGCPSRGLLKFRPV